MLSKEIDVVRRRRAQLRERRQKGAVPTVALVGYTNAGKTTLFNALTGDQAVASDALFVTLDPLVRKVRLPDRRELLVSDTVGFIDRLPHSLVAAFRATLEEVAASDLLVHVIDASNPDRERQMAAVRSVLAEVGADDVPSIEVFNKLDRLDAGERARLQAIYPGAIAMSALTGEGRDELVAALEARLALDTALVQLEFDAVVRGRPRAHRVSLSRRPHPPSRVVGRAGARSKRRCRAGCSSAFVDREVKASMKGAATAALSAAVAVAAGHGGLRAKDASSSRRRPRASPKYPDYIFPAVVGDLGTPAAHERHKAGWLWLQAGDLKAAERNFEAALKLSNGLLSRPRRGSATSVSRKKDLDEAATHFDRAVVANPRYVPALVGRGEALLGARRARHGAQEPRSRGRAPTPSWRALRTRIEVLRVRGLQDDVADARKATRGGPAGRGAPRSTTGPSRPRPTARSSIAKSADVARRQGDLDTALRQAQKAVGARTDRRSRPGPDRRHLRGAEGSGKAVAAYEAALRARTERGARSARSRRCAKAWRSRRCRSSSRRSRARRRCRASSSRRSSACGSMSSSSARRGGTRS